MINLYSNYLYNRGSNRIDAIQVIEDLRYGRNFSHFEEAYVEKSKVIALTEDERRKLFMSNNYMERLISEQVNFAPILDTLIYTAISSINDQRTNRMYKCLKENNWETELLWEIYDNQISKGDAFFEIYFVKDDPVPKLKQLNPKKMTDILLDDYGRPLAYIYKDIIVNQELDFLTDTATIDIDSSRTVTWVFEKGKTTILDPFNILKDEDDNIIYEVDDRGDFLKRAGKKVPKIKPIVRASKSVFKDDIMLLHIPSLKRQGEGFSEIIASRIIDNSLKGDQITTDYHYTNRLAGHPVNIIIDGQVQVATSSRSPGGFINIISNDLGDGGKQASHKVVEISNELKSIENELTMTEVDLYRKMYLFRPDVEIAVAKSDSSRVQQQLRLSLEQFLIKLTSNINNAMNKYFYIAQKSYGYKKTYDFFFKIPDPIIRVPKGDTMLNYIQELNSGLKTLTDIWREQGLSEADIAKRWKEHNAIIYENNKDVSKMANSNLDNNFK